MKKFLVNYSHRRYENSQKENCRTGIEILKFDECVSFNYDKISHDFKEKNHNILKEPRGAGFWIWKPYIVNELLQNVEDNDLILYSDSGLSFIDNFDDIIQLMDSTTEKFISFRLDDFNLNKIWTKRDTFYYMDLDHEPYISNPQILASYFIFRKNKFTCEFIKEWLNLCCDERLVTDIPNKCGLENYDGFRDHRHDQSIFSLLCYKYQVPNVRDVSQWGKNEWYSNQKINHHRNSH